MTAPVLRAFLTGNKQHLTATTFFLASEQCVELDAALVRAGARISHGRYENRSDALMALARAFGAYQGKKVKLQAVA